MARVTRFLVLLAAIVWLAPLGCARTEFPPTKTFDANGVQIAYFVQGEGEPVVLIHGWLSAAGINWVLPGTSAILAKRFQVIGFDVRGHGLSDKPTDDEAYGPELVEDVVRLLDHLKIEKAHIVGYSMGGMIAANFLVKHPDRALSGTLGGSGWLEVGGTGQWALEQIGKKDRDAKPLAACGRSLSKLALAEDEIKGIRVPVVILVGSTDRPIKKLYVEPLVKVRPDWPVIEIDDANHITCVAKEQYRKEIAAWLEKQSDAN